MTKLPPARSAVFQIVGLFAGAAGFDVIVRDGGPAPATEEAFGLTFGVWAYPALIIDNGATVYCFATATPFTDGIRPGTGALGSDTALGGLGDGFA